MERARQVNGSRTLRNALAGVAAVAALAAFAGAAPAYAAAKSVTIKIPLRPSKDMAPLPMSKATHVHAPFQSGKCGLCHLRNDDKNPGGLRHKTVEEECYECHEDTLAVMSARFKHYPSEISCNYCHNPHNSTEPGLLVAEMTSLCYQCHKGLQEVVSTAKVGHDAITQGRKCSNCHNPHASNIERMLIALPFDLCVNCHSKDGMLTSDGKPMTNYKQWLKDNKVWHAPVEAKDCSACHKTHGGDNFRLLVKAYPPNFYAPYDPKNYALCYACHNERVVSEEETTTLTGFRDGTKNLHYVHVHRDRGRTCRACHEVHAAKQAKRVRDSVPYGPKGWQLQVNFMKTPTGGTCAKTCHETKTYVNRTLTSAESRKAGSAGR